MTRNHVTQSGPRYKDIFDQLKTGNLVTGKQIAQSTGISLRQVYRYMSVLQKDGHPVRGERGVGYILFKRKRA